MQWVKLCTKELTCRGYQLALGDNVDTKYEYSPTLCEPGGLHFCKVKDAPNWAHGLKYNWVCDVEIPPDAEATHGNDVSKASKITLSNHRPLRECLDIYLTAAHQNGQALQYVPHELKTPEMCLAAVKQCGWALMYVPQKFKTPDMCRDAVQQFVIALAHVPEELATPEMCLAAVQQCGYMLKYVPVKLKTSEMCLAAFQKSKWWLAYVPEEFKTSEMRLVDPLQQ